MQSSFPWAGLAIFGLAAVAACSDPAAGDDGGGGGEAGTGTGQCSNPNPQTLPIDKDGWVARECNDRGIQGAFYCYDDKVVPTSCPPAAADGTRPPPFVANRGMCISGTTIVDQTYVAWGAGLGLSLNDAGAPTHTKDAYNAAMNGVTGFHIELAGTTGGLPLRVGFTGAAMPMGAQPFVPVPAGVMSFDVAIQDALVPTTWTTDPNAGDMANPNAIYDLQVQITGGDAATAYDFCITNVTPIAMGGPAGGAAPPFGTAQCAPLGTIDLTGRYMVQNNVYNPNGGTQCVTARWDTAANAGFDVSPVALNVAAGAAPASYPSVVLGWHYGRFYGSYTAARTLGSIGSIRSSWTFTAPAVGRYNASYDAWVHPTDANPTTPSGGVELMVWLSQRDTTPIGMVGPTVTIGDASYAVWYGPNAGGWNTVTYVRATNVSSVTNMDLLPFFIDAAVRGYTSGSSYLLGVEAGYEIWEQTQAMSSSSYSVAIN